MKRQLAIFTVYALFHLNVSLGSILIVMDLESNWESPLIPYEDLIGGVAVLTSSPGMFVLPLLYGLPRGPGVVSPWIYIVWTLNACLWAAAFTRFVCYTCRPPSSVPPPQT